MGSAVEVVDTSMKWLRNRSFTSTDLCNFGLAATYDSRQEVGRSAVHWRRYLDV